MAQTVSFDPALIPERREILSSLGELVPLLEARRRGGRMVWGDPGLAGLIAFALERLWLLARDHWRASLDLLRAALERHREGDSLELRLLLAELECSVWAEVAAGELLADEAYPPAHAVSNLASVARAFEELFRCRRLGLRDTIDPYAIPELVPAWWHALRASGEDPTVLAGA